MPRPDPVTNLHDRRARDHIHLPRSAAVEAAMDVHALAAEVIDALDDIYAYVWRGQRAQALLAVSRLTVDSRKRSRAARRLANDAEAEPRCPDGIVGVGHGRAA